MRKDENGEDCPATLGEYLQLCTTIGGPDCAAVELLEQKIAEDPDGSEAALIPEDLQMRMLLMPMLVMPRKTPR